MMEILIHLDEADKKNWQAVKDYYNDLVHISRVDSNQNIRDEKIKLSEMTSDFWHQMIEKYPYLRNKKIGINSLDGYVFTYNSLSEFQKYCR